MKERQLLSDLFDRLFPICRSIAGPGIQESLSILGELLPLEVTSVPSGTKVFDWVVPPEWHIRKATLTGPDGRVYADFDQTNLAVVSFSEPVQAELSLEELQPHLHSIPGLPEAIPYVTSFYNRSWGFCLPHRVRETMPEGAYRVEIDSELRDGVLQYGEAVLPGESDEEVLLTSYLCHPSLANNELSGPLTLLALYKRIERWQKRRYTYRFYVGPETIGSLAYLSNRGEHFRKHLVGGLVLTCTGGPERSLSYKTTRRESALMDQVVRHLGETDQVRFHVRPFDPCGGSDERQFCSPGFDLPVGQIARTVYCHYDGYHNSLDTKEFMGIEPLIDTADQVETVLRTFEYAGPFRNLSPYGEPQLGRRGLYPNVNNRDTWTHSSDTEFDQRSVLNRILTLLNYSDGEHSVLSLAERLDCRVRDLIPVIQRLEEEKLLTDRPEGAG